MEAKHGSGSNSHSKLPSYVTNKSRHSKQSRTYPEVILGNRSTKNMERDKDSDWSGSSEHFELRPQLLNPSASGSGSSVEDLFQMDTNDRFSDECASSYTSEMTSHLHVQNFTNEPMIPSLSPTESPSIQVMDRRGGYNPERIPSNIFASRTMESTDWSTTSNDSLFSLNVNSFSRDQVFSIGGDPGKSGEPRSGEFIIFNPPPTILETEEKDIEAEIELKERGDAEVISNGATEATSGDQDEDKEPTPVVSWDSSYPSRCYLSSDANSVGSPPFSKKKKMKKKKKGCSRCCCFTCCSTNCAQPSCHYSNCCCFNCAWPSCHSSSCSCFKCAQPSCHFSNCCCFECTRPSCYRPNCCCFKCAQPSCHCSNCCCFKCARPSCHCLSSVCTECAWLLCWCCNCSSQKCSNCACPECAWPLCHRCDFTHRDCACPSCCFNCSWSFCFFWKSSHKRINDSATMYASHSLPKVKHASKLTL